MNPLPGNPHYEAAVTNRYAGDARFTEATLAVAWEARTANLQRERDTLNEEYYKGTQHGEISRRLLILDDQIAERLGL